MTITKRLFSFEGRLRRADFWLNILLLFGILVAGMIAIGIVTAVAMMATGEAGGGAFASSPAGIAISGLSLLLYLPLMGVVVVGSLANQARRYHDRDMSAWWILMNFIPLVGVVFWLINLGILDGTPGPNRYGPSPKGLGGQGSAEVFA